MEYLLGIEVVSRSSSEFWEAELAAKMCIELVVGGSEF